MVFEVEKVITFPRNLHQRDGLSLIFCGMPDVRFSRHRAAVNYHGHERQFV